MTNNILITGGSSGLGLQLMLTLSNTCCSQIINLDIIPPPTNIIINSVYIPMDMKSLNTDTIISLYKRYNISMLICNAAVFTMKPVISIEDQELLDIWNINVFSIHKLIKLGIKYSPHLNKIIIISSEGVLLPSIASLWPYIGCKTALENMIAYLQIEQPTIEFSIIRPGAMDTEMLQKLNKGGNRITQIAKIASNLYKTDPKIVAERIVNEVIIGQRKGTGNALNIGHNWMLHGISKMLGNKFIQFIQKILL
jgi:3-oxoacyl-[acyl-carrier protein] reductase